MEKVQSYKNVELAKMSDNYEDFSQSVHLPKIRKDFIAKLENALMFLDYKDLNMYHSEAESSINLKTFDGAWLIDVSLKHNDDENFAFRPYTDLQVTPNMFPNLNLKTLNLSGEVATLDKIRFLDLKERRHLENYKYIYSHRFGFLDYAKHRWFTSEEGFGFNKM